MTKQMYLVVILMLGLVVIGFNIAYAGEATKTQNSTVSLVVPQTANLSIKDADVSKTLTQDGTSELAFDAGYVEFDAGKPTLTLSANKKWKMTAVVTTPFVAVDGYTKATGDLQIKDSGAKHVTTSSYTALSDSANLELASATVPVKKEDHPCQYKILLDYEKDVAGTYSAAVTFTLATVGS